MTNDSSQASPLIKAEHGAIVTRGLLHIDDNSLEPIRLPQVSEMIGADW
jgi:hypothetical protein